ncbi:MAG: hypothetical protein NT154_45140, partial [Verrucomicrobia bacterium]|nr:hypothetical protein [Verrucomicrobiota bacterium]
TADFGYNWTGQIGDYVWWDANRNQIPDNGETPIANAFVMLYVDANNNGILDVLNGDYQIAATMTDVNGYYHFNNLPPGKYLVDVYEDSFSVGGARVAVPTTPEVQYKNLAAGETYLGADFGYFVGAFIQGNVFWDANRDTVPDNGETGLTPVTVTLTGTDMYGNPITATTTTDASGHFSFVQPEGNYTLTYSTPNVLALNPSLTDTTTPTSYSFHAYPGEDWHPVFNFGVDNNGKIGDTIFADANGNGSQGAGEAGLAGVTVELYLDANNNNQVDGGDTLLESQVTDATGKYLFVGLADGNYAVKVLTATLPSGYNTTPTAKPPTEWVAGSEAGATITSGNTVLDRDFGYKPTPTTYTISGNIWSDTDGNHSQNGAETNLANVTLTITVGGVPYTVTNDSSGNYTLAGVPAGSAVVITVITSTLPNTAFVQNTDPDGTLDNQNSFTMPSSSVTGKNFSYQEHFGSISGTVAKGNGNGIYDAGVDTPLASATVTLRYAGVDGILNTTDDVVFTPVVTTGSGAYNFTGLLPGLYEITEANPSGYYSLADRDGGNPDDITTTLAIGENKIGQDFEDIYYKLSGKVFDDANGVSDGFVNGNGTSVGGTLYVNLVNGAGLVVASVLVNNDGTYSFSHLPNGTYTVQVSVNAGTVGQPMPATALPANWVHTGENLGAGAGSDGTPNGLLAVNILADVINANFGIDRLPDTAAASQGYMNPGGTATVTVPTLTGSDLEDGPLGSGKTVVIETLPVNGTLYYNGVAVTPGQVISIYDPTKLTVDPSFEGSGTVTFTYAFKDAAGQVDPSPATAT